jgi:uncharacterized LabA/DUF88 family protein
MKNSVAILWDAENVSPNQKDGLIESVLDYAKKYGQLSVAAVFADWKKHNLGHVDEIFANNSFQLIHVPSSRKNSSDISLITSGIEYLFIYPHIDTYIIVTGDIDFRPLLVSIRRRGCKTIIICDARNASENLLQIADEYFDYRRIVDEDEDDDGEETVKKSLTKNECHSLLLEAIQSIKEKKGIASYAEVKVRMLLLNENFNERNIGFSNWRSFVNDAEREELITIKNIDRKLFLDVTGKDRSSHLTTDPFMPMLFELNNFLHETGEKTVSFSKLNELLLKKKFDIKKFNYTKLKRYLQDAEKRDLVKIELNGRLCSVGITEKGCKYID